MKIKNDELRQIINEELKGVLSEQQELEENKLKQLAMGALMGLGLLGTPSQADAADYATTRTTSTGIYQQYDHPEADVDRAIKVAKSNPRRLRLHLMNMNLTDSDLNKTGEKVVHSFGSGRFSTINDYKVYDKYLPNAIKILQGIKDNPDERIVYNKNDMDLVDFVENKLGVTGIQGGPRGIAKSLHLANLILRVAQSKDSKLLKEPIIPNKVIQIGTKQVNKTKAAMKGVKSVDDFKAKMKDVSYKDYESMHQIGDGQKFLLLIPDGHITDINFLFVDSKTKEYLNFTNNLLELDVHDPFTGKTAYRQAANKNTNINKYLSRIDLDFMSNLGTLTTNKEKQKRLRQNVKGKDLFDLVIRPEQSTKIPEGHVGFVVSLGGIPTRTVLVQFGMTDKATAALPDPNPQGP